MGFLVIYTGTHLDYLVPTYAHHCPHCVVMCPNQTKHTWTSAGTTSACTSEAEYHICVLPGSLWTVQTTPFGLY